MPEYLGKDSSTGGSNSASSNHSSHSFDMSLHVLGSGGDLPEIPNVSRSFQPPRPRKNRSKGRALDLFSGTGSVSNRLTELGYEVVSLDIDPKHSPTLVTDLLEWPYTSYERGHFKIIAASVPCAQYSIARTTAPRDYDQTDALVERVIEIVQYYQPKIWWIENPRTGHLKNRDLVRGLPFVDIDYCAFSDWGYQKPTRFWGSENLARLEHRTCAGKKCPNLVKEGDTYRHREKLGGNHMKFNAEQKGRIPPAVVDYLIREGEFAPNKCKCPSWYMRYKGHRVCPRIRANLIKDLGVQRDKVGIDVFASPNDAQEALYMTEYNSAWAYDWSKLCEGDSVLWVNPPFPYVNKVLHKIALEPCRAILVAPEWFHYDWRPLLEAIQLKQVMHPAFEPIFERNKDKCLLPGKSWRVGVYFIDTVQCPIPENLLDPLIVEEVRADSMGWGLPELRQRLQQEAMDTPRTPVEKTEPKVVIDRVRKKGDLRLIMEVRTRLPSGRVQPLQIRVDTGAETNLIREGLISANEFLPAKRPLCLTTANGQRLRGGRDVLSAELIFNRSSEEGETMGECALRAKFFEADINVDVILGHPWLGSHHLGVFPHVKALAFITTDDHVDWLWGVNHRFPEEDQGGGEEDGEEGEPEEVQVGRVGVSEDSALGDEDIPFWIKELQLTIPGMTREGRPYVLRKSELREVQERILRCAGDRVGEVKVNTVTMAKGNG